MDQSQFGHSVGQFYREPQQQWQQQPSILERWAKMDDTLQQFMQMSDSHHKNNQVAFKRIGSQFVHIIQKLDDLGSNMKANPREECNAVITESGKDKIRKFVLGAQDHQKKKKQEGRKVRLGAPLRALRAGLQVLCSSRLCA
ncbi:hypothetical protein LR48_Vigan01g085400 [Vigna angularis]|uniref:Uncharacterized protein n=1 Tax=Phaseolus angularis TaxID=3914 RepID=A0A0L9TMB0_PHAAN|nr:hypothetical protein LR48_Vigan01g085400 [Vigna angularis]